ncbi:MAG: hypothetical protein M1836_002804 [Candelina mexicana]|nr:MAG: hypothetical protein M1836_002804 [Candelina mexicana]
MDGLSSAASGIAVASLSIQLAENIKKLYEFWESIKDAPDDVRDCVGDLKLLSAALDIHGPNTTVTEIIKSCVGNVSTLLGIVESFEGGFASRKPRVRKWSAFKAALKMEKIRKFRVALQEIKVTLLLARQYSVDSQLEYSSQTLTAIAESLSDIPTQVSRTGRETIADPAGQVDVLSSETRQHRAETCSNREDLQQKMASLASVLADLHVQQSTKITTITAGLQDLGDHVNDLRREIRRMAEAMPNPIFRSGFELAMSVALQEAISRLSFHASASSTQPQLRAGNPPEVNSALLDDEQISEVSDVQSRDHPSVFPSNYSSRKRRRQRMLVNIKSFELKNVFGAVYVRSATHQIACSSSTGCSIDIDRHREQYEVETFFVLHPAPWLAGWGVRYGVKAMVSRSIKGWQNNLKHFRVVANESLIFDFCKEGNIAGVRRLFLRGEASPLDTDLQGRTPLHFAANRCDAQLCGFLLDAGADPCARVFPNFQRYPWPDDHLALEESSPLLWACLGELRTNKLGSEMRKRTVKDRTATLRVFSEVLDFGEEIANGQLNLSELIITEYIEGESSNGALGWTMLQFKNDVKEQNVDSTSMERLLFDAACFVAAEQTLQSVLDCFKDPFDKFNGKKCPILHYRILHEGFERYDSPSLQLLGRLVRPSPLRESRLSVWSSNTNISTMSDFVLRELDEAPLRKAGWKEDTLLALFQFDLDAEFKREDKEQRICARCGYGIRIYREAWWDIVIINIKQRREPYDSWSDNEGRELLVANSSYNYYTGQGQDPDVYELCESCLKQKEYQPEMSGRVFGEELQESQDAETDIEYERADALISSSNFGERANNKTVNPPVDLAMMWV